MKTPSLSFMSSLMISRFDIFETFFFQLNLVIDWDKCYLFNYLHFLQAYDASRVKILEVKNENEANEKSINSVASKTVNVQVQRAVDPEVAALLDDSYLSPLGSDVEDLEEDFVLQANCTEEGISLSIDEKLNLSEEYKVVDEVVDAAVDGYLTLSKWAYCSSRKKSCFGGSKM